MTASARDVLEGRAGTPELSHVRARATWGGAMRSNVVAGRHRFVSDEPPERAGHDEGPTPLQLVLSGLCACEAVTMKRTADRMRMRVEGFEIEAEGVIDVRGRKGTADVPAHFLRVDVRARVRTSETDERVQRLRELVERHCPVATLLRSAPLEFHSAWERAS
ncbi:MAG TPA: OsmC family protein [Candidatus Dormibacteraeota bacterium]|nr:OsmC family protein [Candidatus Dormibacteraeota bacterium]